MQDLMVKRAPLPWWAAGLLLGAIQILAVAAEKPLGVSTQFVVVDAVILHKTAPEYSISHPLISQEKYSRVGYGFWLDVGIILGALGAALATGGWKLRGLPVWAKANRQSVPVRLGIGFIAGILILFGARLAHGCTSGNFASGLSQLALSSIPFAAGLFGFGMLTAMLFYPKTPAIEPDKKGDT